MSQAEKNDFDRLTIIDSLTSILEKTLISWGENPGEKIPPAEIYGATEIVQAVRREVSGA